MAAPDELVSIQVRPPTAGLIDGLDPGLPRFPPDGASALANLRPGNGLWQTRLGMSRWTLQMPTLSRAGNAPGTGNVRWISTFYNTSGKRWRVVFQAGNLLDLDVDVADTEFQTTSGGTGLTDAVPTVLNYGNYLYFSTRGASDALKRYTSAPSSGNQVVSVAQPTAPTTAPGVFPRTWNVLEDWTGNASAAPYLWTESTHAAFNLAAASGGDPTFSIGNDGTTTSVQVNETTAAGGETITQNLSGQKLESLSIAFWFNVQDSASFASKLNLRFEIGQNASGEFTFEIKPAVAGEDRIQFFDVGNLPTISYKRFHVAGNPAKTGHAWISQIVLPGRLQGKYRWFYTYYDPQTGGESTPSAISGNPAGAFTDFSVIGITNKNETAPATRKAAGLTWTHSGGTVPYVRLYRNGGAAEFTTDTSGNSIWLRLPATLVDLSTTLNGAVSAGDRAITLTAIKVTYNAVDYTIAAGDWLLLDKGVSGKQEFVRIAEDVAFTDLVIDGATNTKVTSASHPFTQNDVGRNLVVASGTGFTPGTYTVNSVATGNVATLSAAVGTLGSTGGVGSMSGVTVASKRIELARKAVYAHSSGAAVETAYVDNNPDTALTLAQTADLERNDPPAGIRWLAKAPDGRLWYFGRAGALTEVGVSNLPTVLRPQDQEVFPSGVDPISRRSLTQGFRVNLGGDASGDEIMWGGFYNGYAFVLTRRAFYRATFSSQADYGSTPFVEIAKVGCLNGETVQEVNGVLYWVKDGPEVVRWSGQTPEIISYPRISTTLAAAPSAYWSQWFARAVVLGDGHRYRLFLTPSGGTTNTQVEDYHVNADLWEPVVYYASGVAQPWSSAEARNGPADLREIYAAHPTSGNLFQLDTGLTDNGGVIQITSTSKKHYWPEEYICQAYDFFLRLAGATDTLTITVTTGASEYTTQTASYSVSTAGSGEVEVYQRVDQTTLKGRWLQITVAGSVSNRPAVRECLVRGLPLRKLRIGG